MYGILYSRIHFIIDRCIHLCVCVNYILMYVLFTFIWKPVCARDVHKFEENVYCDI